MKIAEAYVELRVDGKAAEADVKKQANSLGQTFASVFGAVAFGAGIKKSIEAASDLNESVSKTKVIFGDVAEEMIKTAETASRTMGLSKRAYLDGASGLMGLLENLGLTKQASVEWSGKLVQLGSDLASFFNTDPADAVAAIGSAMRGESEPIRAYNVNIDQAAIKTEALRLGLITAGQEMGNNAQAQATLSLIMAQTGAAQGDFARTADGVANSQRTAKADIENSAASLGQVFLPVYQKVVEVVGFLAEKFGALPGPVQAALVGLVGFAALSGPIGTVVDVVKNMTAAMKGLGVTGAVAGGAFIALTAVVVLATMAYNSNAKEKARLRAETDLFVTALNAEKEGQQGAVLQAIAAKIANEDFVRAGNKMFLNQQDIADFIMGKSVPALDELATKFKLGSGEMNDNMVPALQYLKETYGLTQDEAARFIKTLDETRSTFSDAQTQTDAQGKALDALGVSTEQLTAKTDDQKAANSGLTDALKSSTDQFDEASQAADDFRNALDAVFGPTKNLEEANMNLQAAIDDTAAAFKDNGKTLDITTEKGRANRKAVEDQRDAIVDMGVAMVGAGVSTNDAAAYIQGFTDNLRDQMSQAGFTQAEIDDYIKTLGLTPENIQTTVTIASADTAKAELKDMQDQLGDIDAGAAAEITALVDEGKYDEAKAKLLEIAKDKNIKLNVGLSGTGTITLTPGSGGSFFMKAMAMGGRVDGPTPILAGEAGTEAILPLTRPRRMAELLSDPSIGGPVRAAMGGSGLNIGTVNVGSAADYSALVAELDRQAWRLAYS